MLGFTDISQISHQLEELFVAAKTESVAARRRRVRRCLQRRRPDVVARRSARPRPDGCRRGRRYLRSSSRSCSSERGREAVFGRRLAKTPSRRPVVDARQPRSKAPELRQSLRVPIEKLDRLAHLAPEMVVQSLKAFERHTELRRLERMLSRLRDRVREARLTPDTADLDRGAQLADYADALDSVTRRMREFLVNFSDDRVRLNLITEELRQNVIELTMLPVASVFDAFPRAVRDLARTFDKEIELTIRGRETELDKKIIEQISEPLIHLIRNAVDHGIEAPADRERIGKPPAGQLVLSAEQQGNRILITLKDDGCGIDLHDAARRGHPAAGAPPRARSIAGRRSSCSI